MENQRTTPHSNTAEIKKVCRFLEKQSPKENPQEQIVELLAQIIGRAEKEELFAKELSGILSLNTMIPWLKSCINDKSEIIATGNRPLKHSDKGVTTISGKVVLETEKATLNAEEMLEHMAHQGLPENFINLFQELLHLEQKDAQSSIKKTRIIINALFNAALIGGGTALALSEDAGIPSYITATLLGLLGALRLIVLSTQLKLKEDPAYITTLKARQTSEAKTELGEKRDKPTNETEKTITNAIKRLRSEGLSQQSIARTLMAIRASGFKKGYPELKANKKPCPQQIESAKNAITILRRITINEIQKIIASQEFTNYQKAKKKDKRKKKKK